MAPPKIYPAPPNNIWSLRPWVLPGKKLSAIMYW